MAVITLVTSSLLFFGVGMGLSSRNARALAALSAGVLESMGIDAAATALGDGGGDGGVAVVVAESLADAVAMTPDGADGGGACSWPVELMALA